MRTTTRSSCGPWVRDQGERLLFFESSTSWECSSFRMVIDMTSRMLSLLGFVLSVGLVEVAKPARSSADEPKTKVVPLEGRADQYGDPLPGGALARLGTVSWRPGHDIDFLAFAAEGKLVVAREPYGAFRIYDFASGKEVHRLGRSQRVLGEKTHRNSRSVLSAGGRFLAFFAGRDRSLHVWEV